MGTGEAPCEYLRAGKDDGQGNGDILGRQKQELHLGPSTIPELAVPTLSSLALCMGLKLGFSRQSQM